MLLIALTTEQFAGASNTIVMAGMTTAARPHDRHFGAASSPIEEEMSDVMRGPCQEHEALLNMDRRRQAEVHEREHRGWEEAAR